MMTPDESVKNDLERLASRWAGWIEETVARNAMAYIEQLESENMAMKIQRRGDCGVCKYSGRQIGAEPCASCVVDKDRPAWEDMGLPEVENK